MNDAPGRLHPAAAIVLVVLQFALLALLALAFARGAPGGAARSFDAWSLAAWSFVLAGGALGAWAVATNRPGNFNVRPVPKPGAVLVTGGPYRHVRHPMYVALLVAAAGAVVARPDGGTIAAWGALAGVLVAKALAEERGLAGDPAWREYARRTKRFIPFVV